MRKQILITGGAGSLGKAFVKLLAPDHDVVVLDNNEWAIAQLKNEIPGCEVMLRDFADFKFNERPVDTLIHCAAFKHVNLGEDDPAAFIENNVTKTQKLFEMANWYNVDILFISTDKAVEPISTYGFTKALGEKLARHYGGSVARLGNILSSNGSVIPVWEAAIAAQEPIKITDERMTRWVIEDFDAVNQIWHEFINGTKLIIPKMQTPVRIMDILADVLKRHGYADAGKYPAGVETIGMRKGEKLEEKLVWDHETS